MINLDMVGRTPMQTFIAPGCLNVFGGLFPDVVKVFSLHTELTNKFLDDPALDGDSDHSPFRDANIPYIFFFSGLHQQYHTVDDHHQLLNFGNMGKLAHLILHIIQQK